MHLVENNSALVHFSQARQALQKAKTIDEVKAVRDAAERLRLYSKQVGESLEMQNDIAEIKLRAERRAGEMLREGADTGDRRTRNDGASRKVSQAVTPSEPAPSLEEIGISRMQSSRWQSIASIPEAEFEQVIQETKQTGGELTETALL